MPRYQRDGEIVDAIRYQPSQPGHVIHRLSEIGITCLHVQPTTEVIEMSAGGTAIVIQDQRRKFEGAEGIIYPGDWIVWRTFLDIEIVPSPVFEAEYAPLS